MESYKGRGTRARDRVEFDTSPIDITRDDVSRWQRATSILFKGFEEMASDDCL